MYRLALIFAILFNVSAKLNQLQNNNDANWLSDGFNLRANNYQRVGLANKQPLWVLSLKNEDVTNPRLRPGTDQEKKDFSDFAGPLIIAGLRSTRVKKSDPEKPKKLPQTFRDDYKNDNTENEKLTKEIFRVINKFALTTTVEPDSYLTESIGDNEPSIDLYFKGDYTSLIVKIDNKVWHYFISPPSSLPSWFYEGHSDAAEIKVPHNIKNKFYKSLLHLLQMFLGYPV